MKLLYNSLELAPIYQTFQAVVAGKRCDAYFVREYVRPQPGHAVLDLGCGAGNLLPLLGETDYTGIDLNQRYITAARRKGSGSARFIEGQFNDPRLAQFAPFDTVIANGLLHHLDDDQTLSLMRLAKRLMADNGRLVTLDGCFHDQQNRLERFIVARDRGQHVRTVEGYSRLAEQVFQSVEYEVRSDLLRIPYTHFIMSCS